MTFKITTKLKIRKSTEIDIRPIGLLHTTYHKYNIRSNFFRPCIYELSNLIHRCQLICEIVFLLINEVIVMSYTQTTPSILIQLVLLQSLKKTSKMNENERSKVQLGFRSPLFKAVYGPNN